MFEGLFRPSHLVIILVILLLVFGPQKLPQLASALGKTIRDLKHSFDEAPQKPPASEAPKSPPPEKDATSP
jgi:sec-independent protein translocase protein TatA